MATLTTDRLRLAGFRERVASIHLGLAGEGADALGAFRRAREELFREHADSPLAAIAGAAAPVPGPAYFPYDSSARFATRLDPPLGASTLEIDTGGPDGVLSYERVGRLGTPWGQLTLFWAAGYGGGLFLPFRDASAGKETYGAGRYLTDTIKGTFGGGVELPEPGSDQVVLDFNYAYNPSCAYDSRWACPLAPPENRLDAPIRAGERSYPHE